MLIKGKYSILLLVLIGLVCVSIGAGILISDQVKMQSYVKTQAVVVDHKASGDKISSFDDDEVHYAEVVQYVTPRGIMTATNPTYSNSPKSVGKVIEIAYDPEQPSKCIFIKSNLGICLFLISFGAVFLLTAILIGVLEKKAKYTNSGIKVYDNFDD